MFSCIDYWLGDLSQFYVWHDRNTTTCQASRRRRFGKPSRPLVQHDTETRYTSWTWAARSLGTSTTLIGPRGWSTGRAKLPWTWPRRTRTTGGRSPVTEMGCLGISWARSPWPPERLDRLVYYVFNCYKYLWFVYIFSLLLMWFVENILTYVALCFEQRLKGELSTLWGHFQAAKFKDGKWICPKSQRIAVSSRTVTCFSTLN